MERSTIVRVHDGLHAMKRPGFAGGSTFQIGWSHDEQDDDEQIFT